MGDMLEVLKDANLVVRFVMELAAWVALGYWGFESGRTTSKKYGMAIVAALTAAGIWSLFVAPNASVDVPEVVRLVLEVAIFGAAALALLATGLRRLALVFAIVALVNGVLFHVWEQ